MFFTKLLGLFAAVQCLLDAYFKPSFPHCTHHSHVYSLSPILPPFSVICPLLPLLEPSPIPLSPLLHWTSPSPSFLSIHPRICCVTVSSHEWLWWPVAWQPWRYHRRTGWPAEWGVGSPLQVPRAPRVPPYGTPPATARHWKPKGGGSSGLHPMLAALDTWKESKLSAYIGWWMRKQSNQE